MSEPLTRSLGYEQVSAMRPLAMALFGMVWLLRVRSEMKRCAKCRRQAAQTEERTSVATFFTIDAPVAPQASDSGGLMGPTTYCEVHGYNPPKEGE